MEATQALKITQPADTEMHRRMAIGHQRRTGHKLDSVLVSSDGTLWHTVRKCCGETLPDTAPTWDETIPDKPTGN